ncbi:MAG: HlyC/CorC family transporter [Alphaproteobacteria bacterium]|nr:HlyC/CorC family transporter [Alphaproteobacteria bacterium]
MDVLILLLLILLNGVFAMSEIAIVSARRVRLAAMAERGDPGAGAAIRLQEDPAGFLSTVQIGITLVGILAGAYGATALADDLAPVLREGVPSLEPQAEEIAFALVIIATTFLSLVIGELVPKRIALFAPELIAALAARPMVLLSRVAGPAVFVLRTTSNGLIALLGLREGQRQEVTEEEIAAVIGEGTSSGAIDVEEERMIRGVMRLADRDLRSIMTPRPEMVVLDAEKPWDETLAAIRASGHSRFPLIRGSLVDIVGIVQTKDLLVRPDAARPGALAAAARQAIFVPQSISVLQLLDALKTSEVRMALVIDERGEVQGLVTAADILGAIAGLDAFSPRDSLERPVRRADGSWLIDGRMPIEDLEILLSIPDFGEADGGFTTAGGLVLHALGRLPEPGEAVTVRGIRIEVLDLDGRRIDKVLVSRMAEPDG